MKLPVRYKSLDQITFTDSLVYAKLPPHSFWSYVATKIDFTFADTLCAFLYTGRGQHPYAPSLKLKIHLVQVYYNLSDRLTEEKIIGDLFIKRFLGLSVEFFGFDHSTIALDRQRMGSPLFQACHLFILAQMYSLGLWGEHGESWIIDSFPCRPGIAMVGTHRLIQQAMLRVLQQLKRAYPVLYQLAQQSLQLDTLTTRLSSDASPHKQLLAFSKLVAQAHALLNWFQTPEVNKLFEVWTNQMARQKSLQLQEVLRRILAETSRPSDPGDGTSVPLETEQPTADTPSTDAAGPATQVPTATANADTRPTDAAETTTQAPTAAADTDAPPTDATEAIEYEKIPRKNRPADRIISVYDPEARRGLKTKFQVVTGYKTQNLCTTRGVVLNVQVIPAIEHDRDATYDMVQSVQSFWKMSPTALLGDTSYGHGAQRALLASIGVDIVAPVPPAVNPTGLFPNSKFTYLPENDRYRCPNGNESSRKTRNKQEHGSQYYFGGACNACPLREACTKGKSGRSVFRSDYVEMYEQANVVNASEEGQLAQQQRWVVERKNAELKNDCGLGRPQTRSREGLSIKAVLAAIVVNLKLTVRRLCAPKPGFLRSAKQA